MEYEKLSDFTQVCFEQCADTTFYKRYKNKGIESKEKYAQGFSLKKGLVALKENGVIDFETLNMTNDCIDKTVSVDITSKEFELMYEFFEMLIEERKCTND